MDTNKETSNTDLESYSRWKRAGGRMLLSIEVAPLVGSVVIKTEQYTLHLNPPNTWFWEWAIEVYKEDDRTAVIIGTPVANLIIRDCPLLKRWAVIFGEQ